MKRTMICQSTAQQKKKHGKNRLDCVSCPCLRCCILPISGIEALTSQLQMHCLTIRVLAISDGYLLSDGIHILVRYFSPQKPPTKCRSTLRHAAACFNRWCMLLCSNRQ